MFEYDPAKLESVNAGIIALIKEAFGEDGGIGSFALPAVAARLLSNGTINDKNWTDDYFYASIAGPLVLPLVTLHDALVKAGATVNNKFAISSCDRYAAYIPREGEEKVMVFCTQNLTYMVVLIPRKGFKRHVNEYVETHNYEMHIRIITPGEHSRDYIAVDLDKVDWEKHLTKVNTGDRYDGGASSYFRYKDGRDRGYIISLFSESGPQFSDVFYRTENMSWAHPNMWTILDELEAYVSMLDETLEELASDDGQD